MSQYRILGLLARGGMGEIYRARHLELDVDRIIKTIRPDHDESTQLRGQFASEARRAARLQHPNLATVHDFAVGPSGRGYLVMEYVDGLTLHQARARQGGRLEPGLAVEIGIQTLDALACLHEAGLVHRDVSPDNILLTTRGGLPRVVLIDLGISKDLNASAGAGGTLPGTFKGKPDYASPEQFASAMGVGAIDTRSDLYSLGVVLYELVVGVLPPEDGEVGAAARSQAIPLTDATVGAEAIPAQLRPVLEKALAADPARRFQAAGDFRQAFEDLKDLWHTGPELLAPEAEWIRRGWEKPAGEEGCAAVQADVDAAFTTSRPAKRKPRALATVTRWARRHPRRSLVAGVFVLLLPFGLKALVSVPPSADALPTHRAAELVSAEAPDNPPGLEGAHEEEPGEAHPGPTGQQPTAKPPEALGLVTNDPHFALLLEELFRGTGRELSVLGSRAEAQRLARSTGMPKRLLAIDVSRSRSSVEVRNRTLPLCEVMVSARLLEMPSGRQITTKSLYDQRGDCPTVLSTTGRALVDQLGPVLPQD